MNAGGIVAKQEGEIEELKAERDRLKAEVERLRGALEGARKVMMRCDRGESRDDCDSAYETVCAALEPGAKEE